MLSSKLFKSVAVLALAAGSLMLSGCGGGEKQASKEHAEPRSIYTSAVDCEAGGKLTLDQCSEAIETAVAAHDKSAPTYKSQESCEAAEGKGRCERIAEKAFRPRLTAFLLTETKKPVAKPLYLTADGAQGLRTADKQVLLGKDENLTFSKSAMNAYEAFASKKAKKTGAF